MKFVTVTLFTKAMALGVQSSVIPWGGVVTQIADGHLAHSAVLPHGLPLGGTAIVGHPPAAVPAGIPLPGAIPTAFYAATIPAALSAHHAGVPAVVAGQANYVP